MTQANASGVDLDWFAVDEMGSVGYFTSGGGSPVPRTIAEIRSVQRPLVEFFEALPFKGEAIVNPDIAKKYMPPSPGKPPQGDPSGWIDMARRGLYTFDTATPGRYLPSPYIWVARPVRTIEISDLPQWVRVQLERSRIPGQFATSPDVTL